MYVTATMSTRPFDKKYDLSAPKPNPRPRPTTMDKTRLAMMAFVGVLCSGCTLPNQAGKVPVSPILNQIRVETLLQAWQTARVELNMAASTNTQPPPHTRSAMMSPGNAGALTRAWGLVPVRMLVPHPMIWPQYMRTRKIPRPMIAIIVARGTFRLGFEVSSARGAAASQPVRPCREKTTARAKPSADKL